MKDVLISALSALGYPVFLQGSLAPDAPYPASFFTFWNNGGDDANHYDNEPVGWVWDFDVNFYSTDPSLVQSVPLSAIAALRTAGFFISGRGYDIPSGVQTHTGRGFTAQIIETNQQEENENAEENS